MSGNELAAADKAAAWLHEYFTALAAERRATRGTT